MHKAATLFILIVALVSVEAGIDVQAEQAKLALRGAARSEREALTHFFIDGNGGRWAHQDGWVFTDNHCEWYGVTCRKIDGEDRVVELSLSANRVSGISPSLGDLKYLEKLDISFNDMESQLPSSIGNLKNLKTLIASQIRSLNELPTTIGDCTNLEYIDFYHTQMGGNLSYFAPLKKLKFLDVGLSYLQYHPDVTKCESLEIFRTHGQQCVHPEPIDLSGFGNLKNLRELTVESFNCDHGALISESLGKAEKLEKLVVISETAAIKDTIPLSLFRLKNIRELRLGRFDKAIKLPENVPEPAFKNIEKLHLDKTFEGTLPFNAITSLTNLKELLLSTNVRGEIPKSAEDFFLNLTQCRLGTYVSDGQPRPVCTQNKDVMNRCTFVGMCK